MKNLKELKKLKYATFSAIMTALIIVIVLLLNILTSSLNLSYDMTSDKINSLSKETITYLDNLNDEVTIYALYKTGESYKNFDEILSQYESHSNNIKVEYIDPYQNPQFVDEYKTDGEDIPVGSFIVKGSKKFKVVSSEGLIEQGEAVTVNNLEPRLTNAIIYVNDNNTPVIYTVTGHNELQVGANIFKALNSSNFDILALNLLIDEIPENCTSLILTTPQNDYTTNEVNKIVTFLNNGGSAFITTDVLMGTNKPNYDSILEKFGVKKGNYLAVEADKAQYVENLPINIIPTIEDTDVTKNLLEKNKVILLPTVTGIEATSDKSKSIKITTLLSSSYKSYGKVNTQTQTFSFEEGDVQGPLPLSVLVEDSHSLDSEQISRLIVTGTTAIVDDSINSYIGGGNSEFVVASMKYLAGEKEDVYLAPKVSQTKSLTMNFKNVVFILIYSVILVPLAILITGTIIFFRRKNR